MNDVFTHPGRLPYHADIAVPGPPCPRGQEANGFFLCLCLGKLPKELLIKLGDDPRVDARTAKATSCGPSTIVAWHSGGRGPSFQRRRRAAGQFCSSSERPA
jgi:hypothetical protein